jgi:hypothetical protein
MLEVGTNKQSVTAKMKALMQGMLSNLKWRMFHRLNDKGDNSLTEIPGWLTDL